MAQPPPNPANPQMQLVSGENKPNILPSQGLMETSSTIADSNVLSTTTPIPSGTGSAAVDADQTKKRNTSFKITGILPSRPPSNSDDDDADESTVTEDDVPDTAPIHQDVSVAITSIANSEPIKANVGNVEISASKPTTENNSDSKTGTPQPPNLSEGSSSATMPVSTVPATPTVPSTTTPRRNSQQVGVGSKSSGAGGSSVLPSMRTAMALGYRFNIFVYDHKLGKSH